MSDKIARLGIKRDNNLMYYIKNGDVWATPRKQPGQPKGKPQKVAAVGLEMDYSRYLYFLDGDGDVARKERAVGGVRRLSSKPAKVPRSKAPQSKGSRSTDNVSAADFVKAGKKSDAQLDREIEECLAKAKKSGNGADDTSERGKERRR